MLLKIGDEILNTDQIARIRLSASVPRTVDGVHKSRPAIQVITNAGEVSVVADSDLGRAVRWFFVEASHEELTLLEHGLLGEAGSSTVDVLTAYAQGHGATVGLGQDGQPCLLWAEPSGAGDAGQVEAPTTPNDPATAPQTVEDQTS